jgi:hypothetical protein
MSDEETWRQVVDSDNRQNWKVTDVAQLGPAPRTLTPAHEKYIKLATASAVATLVIMFTWLSVISYGMAIAMVGVSVNLIATPIVLIVVAVLVAKARGRKRDRLRTVLRDGDLRLAMLHDTAQIQVGRGLRKKYRYVSRFSVDQKPIVLRSWDDGMSMLPVGTPAEVLWHPEHPDLIIPALLLL